MFTVLIRLSVLPLSLFFLMSVLFSAETELEKADSFEKEKKYEQAANIWESLVQKEPRNANYLYRLGRVYAWTQRYEESEKLLIQALRIDPKSADTQLSLAYLYLWTHRSKEAKGLFIDILKVYPNYEEAKEGLAKIEQRNQIEFEHLKKGVDEGQKQFALLLPETHKEANEKATQQAEALEKEKAFKAAEMIWSYLVKQEPNSAYYLYKLGRVYAFMGRYAEAEKLLTRAFELNPKDADLQLTLAYLYFWTKREEKAKELFNKILKEHPTYAEAREGLEKIAESVREKEQEKKKEEVTDKKTTPEFAPWQAEWIKVAEMLEKRKRYCEALIIWSYLLNTAHNEPTDLCFLPPAHSTIEHTLFQTGIQCCEQQCIDKECEKVKQQQKVFAFHIGQLHSWKGEWREATYYLNYALVLDPKYDSAWLRLGYVALFSGQYSWARQIFWGLLCQNLDKPDPDAQEGFAKASQALIDNCLALQAYSLRICLAKPTYFIFKQRASVLKWTNPWLKGAALYALERETDLITKVPSAQRETLFGSLAAYYPLNDQSRFFISGYGGTERELNLVADRNNFYVAEWKYGVGYDRLISPWLALRSWCDVKAGRDIGEPIFPLGYRERFEPGATLLYNRPNGTASVSAVRDSFIVKEFSKSISTFLPRETYTGQVEYGFWNGWISTGLLGFYSYYHDRPLNRQWEAQTWTTMGFPRYDPYLFVQYKGRLGGYKFTETDYYSYSRQWEHFAKIYLLKETNRNSEVELGYQRSWQWSRDLNQPINTTIFVPRLFRITNKAYFEVRHLYRPNINLMLHTEYNIDTTDNTAWLARGEIQLVF